MGFSPHASLRAWFDHAGRRRVCGRSPALKVKNIVRWRPMWVLWQALRFLTLNALVQSAIWAAITVFPLSKLNPKQITHNQIKMPKSFLILVIFLMVLWHSTVSFAGPPLLPAAFYGTIIRDDPSTPPADMVVVAAIDDIEFARGAIFQNGEEWVYSLKVPADNPSTEAIDGGRPGDTVTFSIGGESLGQATWEGGSNTQVDLVLSPVEAAAPDESAVSPSWSPQWMPWLLILLALMLVGAAWLLFIRPRLRKT